MSMLECVWKVVQKLGIQRQYLPMKAKLELVHCLATLPLLCCYFRSEVDTRVSASDPSETGGGVCVTAGLTPEGIADWTNNGVLKGNICRDEIGLITVGDIVG
eukprot:4923197-Amphidinium_carterae.1